MALASGTKRGPYEIQSPLRAGGMGEVYRALDTRLERTVAIKVLASSSVLFTGTQAAHGARGQGHFLAQPSAHLPSLMTSARRMAPITWSWSPSKMSLPISQLMRNRTHVTGITRLP
jgi:serine/threonine protein kinase